jgi:predicted AlkP superfamily pyrophosphatase or phosphodiesterase
VRCSLAAVLAFVAACGHPSTTPKPSAATAGKPRLVVLIVIDQFPSWAFAKQKSLFTGGIARLLREGAFVPEAELPYASTFTAVGHATISTGVPPRVSGIVGNYWFRRAEGRDHPAEYDGSAPVFVVGEKYGPSEVSPEDGASGRALRVAGIADALHAATNGAGKSVSVSLKSRAACLVAGKQPDLAIWYEAGAGGMTTSSAYVKELPRWLADLAKTDPAKGYFQSPWTPGDPALLARATGIADASPGEGANHGLDNAFPHSLADSDRPDRALNQTPFADELVAHTATVALDALQLGADDTPDLLAVSFSAHDYAGHSWGTDSWEEVDLTLRLDRTLGELFDQLDKRVGADRWAAVLTSDHGATRLIERGGVAGARRVPPSEIEAVAKQALDKQQPGKAWVAHLISSNLYITPPIEDLPPEVRGPALDAVVTAISAVPSVGAVGRTDTLSADCSGEQGRRQLACRGSVVGESGDVYVYPADGSVISDEKFGTGHDAASNDTRHVPILVKAPGLAPQEGTGTLFQVAPTVCALLGIPPPPAARGKPLFGIRGP